MPFGKGSRAEMVWSSYSRRSMVGSDCHARRGHRAHRSRCRWHLRSKYRGGACGLPEVCRAPPSGHADQDTLLRLELDGTLRGQRDNVGRRRRGLALGLSRSVFEIRGIYQVSYLAGLLRFDGERRDARCRRSRELAAAWRGRAQVIETSREKLPRWLAPSLKCWPRSVQSMRWSTVRVLPLPVWPRH